MLFGVRDVLIARRMDEYGGTGPNTIETSYKNHVTCIKFMYDTNELGVGFDNGVVHLCTFDEATGKLTKNAER